MQSIIYWHPLVYRTVLRILYGKEYSKRYELIAEEAGGMEVLDLCCGDCKLAEYVSKYTGADFNNPDFMKLADSFGVDSARVSSPAELKPVLARAIEGNSPALIEVVIKKGSEISPWEFIHPAV